MTALARERRRPPLPAHLRVRPVAPRETPEALIGRTLADVLHDLAGHLTALGGALALAGLELERDHPAAADVSAARAAADEITRLRAWLLGYVRGDAMPAHLLDLGALVQGDLPMFRRLLADRASSHVRIEAHLAPDLSYVLAEPTPLRRLLLNLVINARDACDAQERGSIVITTRNETIGGAPHVVLSVRDNGQGMSPETRRRVMTPGGHTTKGSRGHGRGMAACLRTARALGGRLHVASAQGYGTVAVLELPAGGED